MSYSSPSVYQQSFNCCRPIGLQGPQGSTGPKGQVGGIGSTGPTGPSGVFNGASFLFTYNSLTTPPPSLGDVKFEFNGFPSSTSSSTIMYINNIDISGTAIKSYMTILQSITGPYRGRVTITSVTTPSNYLSFYINSVTPQPTLASPIYWELVISGAFSSGPNPFSHGESVIIAFVDQGQTGDTGATGPMPIIPDISSNANFSFVSDVSNGLAATPPLRSLPLSFNLFTGGDASNAYGWPILPSSVSYIYNLTGLSPGAVIPVSLGGHVGSWSIAMPNDGYIIGASILTSGVAYNGSVAVANYDSVSSPGTGYTSGINFQPLITSIPTSVSSLTRWIDDGLTPLWSNRIQFSASDHIGVYLFDSSGSAANINPPQVFVRVDIYVWINGTI